LHVREAPIFLRRAAITLFKFVGSAAFDPVAAELVPEMDASTGQNR